MAVMMFITDNFVWEIAKWSDIKVGLIAHTPEFMISNDYKVGLWVSRNTNTNYCVGIRFFHCYKQTINCKISFFATDGKKILEERKKVVSEGSAIKLITTLDTKKVVNDLLVENMSIILFTLFVEGYGDTVGSTSSNCPTGTEVSRNAGNDKLSQDFKGLLLDREDCDVTLKVKEVEFPAHKAILRSRSSVFRAMLQHDMMEKINGVVNIDDCDPDCFPDYLLYMYSGQMNISRNNVVGLYWISDKYATEELKATCVSFMLNDLDRDNFCDYITLALRHVETALLNSAKTFFTQNMRDIIGTDKWLTFTEENPSESRELIMYGLSQVNLTPR